MTTYETMIVTALAVLLVFAAGIFASLLYAIRVLRQTMEPLDRVSGTVESFSDRMEPVLRNIGRTSEQVHQISTRLKGDAARASQTLEHAAESTERMIGLVEERVTDVVALATVAQEEAEEAFLATASLVRSLRRGGDKVAAVKSVARTLGNMGRDD